MDCLRQLFSFDYMRFIIPGLFGLSGIILGAYAHHGLAGKIPEKQLKSIQTAVEYQNKHALVLLAIAALVPAVVDHPKRQTCLKAAFGLMTAGVFGFSFTIYLRAWIGESLNWTGVLTPLGGLMLMAGWGAVILTPFF